MIKKAMNKIKMIETDLGIFNRVKKSKTGESRKERKTAKEIGKRTGFASLNTTPAMKITIITRQATTTLSPFIFSSQKQNIL
jgi:hypothetical protein